MSRTTLAPANPIPTVSQLSVRAGLSALKAMRRGFGGILPVLEMVRAELGDVFQLTLPNFNPVVVASPAAIKDITVTQRDAFRWQPSTDPVGKLLRRGVLVTDGKLHHHLRSVMEPSNQRGHFLPKTDAIRTATDQIIDTWRAGQTIPLLDEMRKIALLVFEQMYFSHNLLPELDSIWQPMLDALEYISPGMWVIRPNTVPNPPKSIAVLNNHLLGLIAKRRGSTAPVDDMLTHLVQALDDDELVRDQLLTMLIAGHDTSTAQLAWTLHLLGKHPDWLAQVQHNVRDTLGDSPPTAKNTQGLIPLQQTIKESLRLFPPIHAGNRFAVRDVEIDGYSISAGTRVMVSIFLAHRHPDYWENPAEFHPQRWQKEFRPAAFSYIPFGAGPRNCIGGDFAQHEISVVLSRILQRTTLSQRNSDIRMHMGATLEPRPNPRIKIEAIQ